MTVSVELPELPGVKDTVADEKEAVGPEGEMAAARFTFPENPF